jgi:hypothetical protein
MGRELNSLPLHIMAIVYKHIRKDTNEVFYIGIGKSEKRAYSKRQRNKHWRGVVNKYGYDVEIIQEGLSWEEAQKVEIELIYKYGRHDLGNGSLVNQTDGGEGNNNQICTEETRLKMSKSHKGRVFSEETRKKISEAKKGVKQSSEHRENNRLSKIGKTHSDETKKLISQITKGRLVPDGVKEHLSIVNSQFKYEKWVNDGELIETYDSMYLALQSINRPATYRGIYHAIKRGGSCAGFIWKKVIQK